MRSKNSVGLASSDASFISLSGGEPQKRPAWAERTLASGTLQEARALTRPHQRQHLNLWEPCPGFWESWSSDERVKSRLSGEKAVLGLFAGQKSWAEPQLTAPPGIPTAYPAAEPNGTLGFRVCREEELVRDPQSGLREPPDSSPRCEPTCLLVPCLFLDAQGRRIGRGRGYYDRYLSQHPEVFSVGVVHSDYFFESLPEGWLHSGDCRVAGALTETFFTLSTKEILR